jgi:hypothetical protein
MKPFKSNSAAKENKKRNWSWVLWCLCPSDMSCYAGPVRRGKTRKFSTRPGGPREPGSGSWGRAPEHQGGGEGGEIALRGPQEGIRRGHRAGQGRAMKRVV